MYISTPLILATLSLGAFSQSVKPGHLKRDEKPLFPFDPNTTKYCTWWWDNDGSIPCADMPATWGITLAQFTRWNPILAAGCQNFVVNKSFCVEAIGEPAPSSTTTTTTSSKPSAPGPTQTGQAPNCDRWDFVNAGDTCDTFVAKYPGLTLQLLTSWNAAVGSTCNGIWAETYLCTRVTGWTPSPTTTGPATTTTAANGVVTPTPIREGTVSNCGKFYLVVGGDECGKIATANGITLAQFTSWNPSVGSTCASLWADVYVCVALIGSATTTSRTTTTSANGIATPTPIQANMVTNCDAFYLVKSGDGCAAIAQARGISLAQLYTWNPAVNNCGALWPDYYICVSIIGHTPTITTTTRATTTAGNGIATPSPTQAGMVGNCDAFHKVVSGDTCATIAQTKGITVAQFISWNSGVGSNCGSLWLDTYFCVSIVGVNPSVTTTTRTTTRTGNGVTTPSPIQTGMVTNCNKFYKVVAGDNNCANVASKNSITTANFIAWNPAVGSGCANLWLDTWYCVGRIA